MVPLVEHLTFKQARMVTESSEDGKTLSMKGICIQGNQPNANGRNYPITEIKRAVDQINEQISQGRSVLGEVDHPSNLRINLDRVCHTITQMWMDGPNGFGTLKILPTPMGNIIRVMLENGVQLGVSSRGSGEVDPNTGEVKNFDMVTVDIVAQPSAPDAYPKAIYEGLMNMRGGYKMFGMAAEINEDPRVQKYLTESIKRFINELKL